MRGKTALIAIVAVACLVALAFWGQRHFLTEDPPVQAAVAAPPAPAVEDASADGGAAAQEPVQLTVVTAGSLERLGDDGTWSPLEDGATLTQSDRIRTSEAGSAVIRGPDGSRVELVDDVDLFVATLTRSLAELELRRGRLRAALGEESDLALRIRSSGAVAEGRGGTFTVYADGEGMLAVASETAAVRLRAQEQEVAIAAGQQAVAHPGQAPTDPVSIPEEVFLEVAWPRQALSRQKRLTVRGAVTPGSEVRLAGEGARVAPDGSFEAEVELSPGSNKLNVSARDPAGRERSAESPTIVFSNRPPRLEPVKAPEWDRGDGQ